MRYQAAKTKDSEHHDASSATSYISRCVKAFIMQGISDFHENLTNLSRIRRYLESKFTTYFNTDIFIARHPLTSKRKHLFYTRRNIDSNNRITIREYESVMMYIFIRRL